MALNLSDIDKARSKLKSVVTVVFQDGYETEEKRGPDGRFVEVTSPDNDDDEKVSNRQKKKRTFGYKKLTGSQPACLPTDTHSFEYSCSIYVHAKTLESIPFNHTVVSFLQTSSLLIRFERDLYVIDLKPDLQVAKICDGVYLSSQDVVIDLHLLKSNGITHIVNAATGISNVFETHFIYLNVNLLDLPDTNIRYHFDSVFGFMNEAVEQGGSVLVHCNAGVSRSATLVIAYIMKHQKLRFEHAFDKVKGVRPSVRPNEGFLKQLHDYDLELASEQ